MHERAKEITCLDQKLIPNVPKKSYQKQATKSTRNPMKTFQKSLFWATKTPISKMGLHVREMGS